MSLKFNPFTGTLDIVNDASTIYNIESQSGTFSAINGKTYLVDTSGGVATVNLPAPAVDAFVVVKDSGFNANTNNITVARNASEDIEGVAGNYTMDSDGETKVFTSDGTDWFIV
jgi:hypothetical protein